MNTDEIEVPKKKSWKWPIIWLSWIALGIGIEVYALIDAAPDDTLSEQVWNLMDFLRDGGMAGKVGLAGFTIGLLGFFGWLSFHFITRKV